MRHEPSKVDASRPSDPFDRERGLGERVDLGPLQHWIAFDLRVAQVASFQAFARLAHDLKLSPGVFAVLTLIGQNPGISQTELSRAVRSDKSTLTPALSGLVKQGLIKRQQAVGDKRIYRLSLTQAGKRLLDRLTDCAKDHQRNLSRVIGERDYDRFNQILKKISAEIS